MPTYIKDTVLSNDMYQQNKSTIFFNTKWELFTTFSGRFWEVCLN